MLKFKFLLLLPVIFFLSVGSASASQEVYRGEILSVLEEEKISEAQTYQRFWVGIVNGERKGDRVAVESGFVEEVGQKKFVVGDRVVLERSEGIDGEEMFFISDYVRHQSLFWLTLIFLALVLAIGRRQGLFSILGMVVSFLVIIKLALPWLLTGASPVLVVLVICALLMPILFFLSHGLTHQAKVALLGAFVALVITIVLSSLFVRAAHLTGFASDEAAFLQVAHEGEINIQGLLLAGMIIGMLGILDDVTISQVEVVAGLKEANARLSKKRLYDQAMKVGRGHIGSMVNTLFLVYAGASLPLLLLFRQVSGDLLTLLNYEIVSVEIVRALVGSIGLIVAVPLTTWLAVNWSPKKK